VILELADLRIHPGKNAAFEKAINHALLTVFPKAKGFKSHKLHRCVESPERYVLQLTWETLENHTVDFRGSPLFAEWRGMVGEFFASPPNVEHFELVD
jgi:heme-degrading monooxygenase HmoA